MLNKDPPNCAQVWCVDHDYKGLGTYFSVLNPEGPGCTTAEVITLFEIDSHYIFDNVSLCLCLLVLLSSSFCL